MQKQTFSPRAWLASLMAVSALAGHAFALAQVSDDAVRLGMLMDLSGPYADITGRGSVMAAQMAIEDFGGEVLGKKIELLSVDHQNKADIAASKAREWFDKNRLDAIVDVTGSAPAIAVLEVARQKNRITLFSGPGTERLTNDLCASTLVHYVYDTYALANSTAQALTQRGGKKWYFLTADYTFGHSLETSASKVVKANGGEVLGAARHPISTSDFAAYLLQAKTSGADVVGLANAGADTVNAIKSAAEFGLTQDGRTTMAGLLLYINDVHALGLPAAQGLVLTEAFYWDMNEATRQWSRRYFARVKSMPNMSQAGVYSSVMHYLKAIKAAGTDDTEAVMRQMKATPIDDFFATGGHIREDGRMVHDMYLFEVKKPEESKEPWDYYKLLATIPGQQAFMPLAESQCPLVQK